MVTNRTETKPVSVSFVKNRATPADVESVPILIPDAVMNELKAGDASPYFRVESIAFPADGDNPIGYKPAVYDSEFFESFIAVMNERPVPGSKRGHEFASRPHSDFYTVGGKIENGVAHFRIYIPPEGDGTSNSTFIRDNRAGIVEFSIEAAVEYSVNAETQDVKILSVKGAERNDAVPQGAMAQTVNAGDGKDVVLNGEGDVLMADSIRNARAMISAGKYDARKKRTYNAAVKRKMLGDGDWKQYRKWHLVECSGSDPDTYDRYEYACGDGEVVTRSALQAIVTRASARGLEPVAQSAARLLDLIEGKEADNARRSLMDDKNDVLEFLRVNNAMPLEEIAEVMGQSAKLATPEAVEALAVVNGLNGLGITDPVAQVTALQAQVRAGESERIANRLTSEFGPEKDAAGNDNLLRSYAAEQITNAENLDEQIETVKNSPVAKRLAGERADFTSAQNRVVGIEQNDQPADNDGPIVTDY